MKWIVPGVLLAAGCAAAQDTRKVVEPAIPAACVVLTANIGRAGASIAPDDESKPDTERIQAAMDHCEAGRAVVLRRGATRRDAFLTGPLNLRKGVTLVVERGAYLYGSRNPRDYDRSPGVCGTIAPRGGGCKALINGDDAADAGIMGDGVIDGRGGETMLGQRMSWWNLADEARKGGNQNNPRLIQLRRCDNFTLYRITLMNAPMFHVSYSSGNGFTAWGVKIRAPQRARNTDGIDPGNSSNVTITHCFIYTGDDHVAVKAGTGAATKNISVTHNHFYAGHGFSIGSETNGGASDILVSDISVEGADNAIHLKGAVGRGGPVRNITVEDMCVRDTSNPLIIDASYTDSSFTGAAATQAEQDKKLIPWYRDVLLRNVRVEGPGKVTLEGFDAAHRLGVAFENVVFTDAASVRVQAKHAEVSGAGFNLT